MRTSVSPRPGSRLSSRPFISHWLPLVLISAGLGSTSRAQLVHDWVANAGSSWEDPLNWLSGVKGSSFTSLDTAQLAQDFLTGAWSLDAAVTINQLVYDDTGIAPDVAATLDGGTGGYLTLAGVNPIVTTRSPLTLNTELVAPAGFTKNGVQSLTLAGLNPGLAGVITVADAAGTNSNGLNITSIGALGAVPTVNVLGSASTGGFFRLAGAGGIKVPATVTFNLTGPGGNSAPPGTLVSGGTGVNVIEGTINVLGNSVRISNVGAARMDIAGPIIASGTNGVIFRQGTNQGVYLLNPGNSWTGLTVHSGGVLWFEPGTLPNTALQHAASDPGVVQTRGTFTRALGTAVGQMYSTYMPNGVRETGFSARGGDLTVNLGGAGADVVFMNFQSVSGTINAGSNIITPINTTGYVVGMALTGTNIPANSTITAIGTNALTINTTPTVTSTNAVAGSTSNNARWQTNQLNLNWDQADGKLTFVNNLDLNGFVRDLSVRASEAEITGIIKNGLAGTNVGFRKLGLNGTLTLRGANTFTGNVDVSLGKLRLRNSAALGTGNKTIFLTNGTAGNCMLLLDGSGGNLDLPASTIYRTSNTLTATSASFVNEAGDNILRGNVTLTSGGGGTRIQSIAGKITFAGNFTTDQTLRVLEVIGNGDTQISGNIINGTTLALPVTKKDAGTLTLSGINSYTGATTLEGGLTLVNGTLGNTPVIVKTTATLGGSGSINGPVTVETGGTLSPGNSPGLLNTGSLDLQQGSSLVLEIRGATPGQSYDQVVVHGQVQLDAAAGLDLRPSPASWQPAPGEVIYPLLNDGADPIQGQPAALPEGATFRLGGRLCRISYQGNGDHGPVPNDLSLTFLLDPAPPL